MEETLNYKELYSLQDKILKIVFSLDTQFYLTGGSALHRYYLNKRYSDDLDFFTQSDPLFNERINQILFTLTKENLDYKRIVSSKDFGRVMVANKLQLDFVNDYVYREGYSEIIEGYKIDNIINILANKLGALIGRDEEKDFFDLFAIAYSHQFNWHEIWEAAQKKTLLDLDQLCYRIESFPTSWLDRIKIITPLSISQANRETLVRDLREGKENSLVI